MILIGLEPPYGQSIDCYINWPARAGWCILSTNIRFIGFPLWFHFLYALHIVGSIKVKSMQRSGTKAIRTQIQPSKPKRKIINIINSQIERDHVVNRVSSYFPKGGHSATETELKIIRTHIR